MTKREYETRETSSNRNEESTSSFLLGAIVGGVVGAVTALLLAPKTGKEIRNSLGGQAGTLIDKTAPLRENVKSKTISLSQGIAQQSTDLLNKVKRKPAEEEEEEQWGESETNYISLPDQSESKEKRVADSDEIRKRIAEAEKALEKEEIRIKL